MTVDFAVDGGSIVLFTMSVRERRVVLGSSFGPIAVWLTTDRFDALIHSAVSETDPRHASVRAARTATRYATVTVRQERGIVFIVHAAGRALIEGARCEPTNREFATRPFELPDAWWP